MPIGAFRTASLGGGRGRPHLVAGAGGFKLNSSTSGNVIAARPDDAEVGDLLLCGIVTDSGAITPPAGWDLIAKTTTNYMAVWRRRLAAGDPTQWTWTHGSSHHKNGVMITIRSADPTFPIADAAVAEINWTSSGSKALPPVTTPSTPAVGVAFLFSRSLNVFSYTPDSPLVEIADHKTATSVGAAGVAWEEEPPLVTMRSYTSGQSATVASHSGGAVTLVVR